MTTVMMELPVAGLIVVLVALLAAWHVWRIRCTMHVWTVVATKQPLAYARCKAPLAVFVGKSLGAASLGTLVDPAFVAGPLGLAQHELLHLSGRCLGQRPEGDRVGALEVGEAARGRRR